MNNFSLTIHTNPSRWHESLCWPFVWKTNIKIM